MVQITSVDLEGYLSTLGSVERLNVAGRRHVVGRTRFVLLQVSDQPVISLKPARWCRWGCEL